MGREGKVIKYVLFGAGSALVCMATFKALGWWNIALLLGIDLIAAGMVVGLR
jgi:hypothetical protein